MSADTRPISGVSVPRPRACAPFAVACLATGATLLTLPYLAANPDRERIVLTTDVRTIVLPPPAPLTPATPTPRPRETPMPAPRPLETVAIRLPVQPVFDLRLNVGAGGALPAARFDLRGDTLVNTLDTAVFDLSEIDQPPQPVVRLKPVYPAVARMRGLEGAVVLEFTVTADGTTRDVTVVESAPPDVFDEAAVRAVAHWRFRPGLQRKVAVPVRVRQRVAFELEE